MVFATCVEGLVSTVLVQYSTYQKYIGGWVGSSLVGECDQVDAPVLDLRILLAYPRGDRHRGFAYPVPAPATSHFWPRPRQGLRLSAAEKRADDTWI